MKHVMRIDAPEDIRDRDASVADGGWVALAGLMGLLAAAGLVALVIQLVGHSPIGAGVCVLWLLGCLYVTHIAARNGREIMRWRQQIVIGEYYIEWAHVSYWKLEPETRTQYGLPLVRRMYELTLVDARGDKAIKQIEQDMRSRWWALSGLVDAEDKIRMYAADPLLKDRDDVDTAKIWQVAIADVERALRGDPVRLKPGQRPPPNPMPGA